MNTNRFLIPFLFLVVPRLLPAQPVDKKLVVVGSSVPRGFGAYTAGAYTNDDLDDVDGNGSPDTFASRGYAGLIKAHVEAKGWTFDNQCIGGNDTADVLARFDADVVPENPEILLIGLSMGNEGLAFTDDPKDVMATFETGMLEIIRRTREEGFYPVVGLVYPHRLYNAAAYDAVKRMNLKMNAWDVPSINLLGAIDDGRGRWAEGFELDSAHPNVPGHEEMYHAVVPSLFDAIDQGKTAVPVYPASHAFMRLTRDALHAAPLTYTPAEPMRAFTTTFKIRTSGTGTVASVRMGAKPLFRVDFGPSDDVNGRATSSPDVFGQTWNNWRPLPGGTTIPPGTRLEDLVTVDNQATSVDLEVTDAFSGSNGRVNGGLATPEETRLGTLAVGTATEDYFFETGTAAFRLTGLDPARRYTFRLFGTRQTTDVRETRYTVSGAMSYSPFAFLQTSGDNIGGDRSYDGNDANIVMISGVQPTAAGEITVTVAPEQGGYAYLGAMEVLVEETGPGSRHATVEVRGNELAYVAPDGREITVAMDADNGAWHEVALAHRYAQQETLLFVDGRHMGSLRESLSPDLFVLGGSGISGLDAPGVADYQDWCVYRAAWTDDEAMAQHRGAFQQASLEICAALDDGAFPDGAPVDNRAQSLSSAVVDTPGASAPVPVAPPDSLSAFSREVDTVELTWVDHSATETGLVIERRAFDEGRGWEVAGVVSANATRFEDNGLSAGTHYSYRVSSREGGVRSAYSETAPVRVGEAGRSYRAWISDTYDLPPATYRIDFNTTASPDYGGEVWNTVNDLTATAAYPLVDIAGDGSAGYFVRIRNGFDQFRSVNGSPLTDVDDDPQNTSFITTDTATGGAVIVLAGLDPDRSYDLELFCRRGSIVAGFDYTGRYTITGGGGAVVYDHDNALSTERIQVLSLRPDAGGLLTVGIEPTDTANGSFFAGINFLILREVLRPHLVDFNADPDPDYPSGYTWNVIQDPADATPHALVDAVGNPAAGITLTVSRPFTTTREGDGAASAGGMLDLTAQSTLFALTGSGPAEIRIGGLDPARSYEIAFLAKRNAAVSSFDYSAIYTLTGAGGGGSLLIDAAGNSRFGMFSRVVPDVNGDIVLEAAPNPDPATPSNEFVVLNLLRISVDGAAEGDLPSFAPDEDSDHDGCPNVLEYILDLDPAMADAVPFRLETVRFESSSGQGALRYPRSTTVQGLRFELQFKQRLSDADWTSLAGTAETVAGWSGALDQVELTFPAGSGTGFYRLCIRE